MVRRLSAAQAVIRVMSEAGLTLCIIRRQFIAAGVPRVPEVGAALIGRKSTPEEFATHLMVQADQASINADVRFQERNGVRRHLVHAGNSRSGA
ncbi:MAG: hypothetical protein MRJ92_10965 [Nitrospira sp.]|nr:hypothetical protein [Nitrospira sp.]